MSSTLTRESLVEVIRAAYVPGPGPDEDGPVCACCWGVTCPEHAAAAVLAALDGGDLPIYREER